MRLVLFIVIVYAYTLDGYALPSTEINALLDFITSIQRLPSDWNKNDTSKACTWTGIRCENSHVVSISLQNAQMEGYMPESTGDLTELQKLDLSGNYLSGSIPRSLGSLSKLSGLFLSSNQLSGSLDNAFAPRALKQIYMDHNDFYTSIPSSFNATDLVEITLQSSKIQGEVPSFIGQLSKLQVLDLSENNLVGSLPDSIGNLSALSRLNLYQNLLNSTIPSTIGNMTSLRILAVNDNQFDGCIPLEILKLPSLINCDMSNNNFDCCDELRPLVCVYDDFCKPTASPTNSGALDFADESY